MKNSKAMLPRATKTQLAKLVQSAAGLIPGRAAQFSKYRRSYWLDWAADDGWYKAYFSAAAGRPVLLITAPDGSQRTCNVSIDQLKHLNMVEYCESLALTH